MAVKVHHILPTSRILENYFYQFIVIAVFLQLRLGSTFGFGEHGFGAASSRQQTGDFRLENIPPQAQPFGVKIPEHCINGCNSLLLLFRHG